MPRRCVPPSRFPVACLLATFLVLGMRSASAQDPEASGWRPLFDGRTLEGWKATENPHSFRVEDGVILAAGPRSHLYYAGPGAELECFELLAEVRTDQGSNGGIFFHTRPQPDGWPAHGYEVQVNNSGSDPIRTGSLYAVVNVSEAPARDDTWFEVHLLVQRSTITVKIDGKTVVRWTEPPGVTGPRRLSHGTIALQAHDPKSVVRYRNLRVRELPDPSGPLTRAERYLLRPGEWWERMDYGPFLTATVGIEGLQNVALKGITLELAPDRAVSATFDTDLLRMAAGWEGGLDLVGVTYDGSHGGHPMLDGRPVFVTRPGPGWTATGSFEDPRPIPHGPVPDVWGRYRGLHRHGERILLAYDVGGATILELPAWEAARGLGAITRTFEIGPRDRALAMVVADLPEGTAFEIAAGGRAARANAPPPLSPLDAARPGDVLALVDRTEGPWSELATGAPSDRDSGERSRGARAGWAPEFAPPHRNAGARENELPRVNDGDAAHDNDDIRRSAWLDGPRARVLVDLGATREVQRIHTYSWHRDTRAPQRFSLWASDRDIAPDAAAEDLATAGWTRLAEVDTRALGIGGKHVSCILRKDQPLGRFRHLLWDLLPDERRQGLFFSEIDVWTREDGELPPLGEPAQGQRDRRPLTVALSGAPGVRLEGIEEHEQGPRLVLRVPEGTDALRFKLILTRDVAAEPESLAGRFPKPEALRRYQQPGLALWPQTLTLAAAMSAEEAAYVVDDIPLPFENPWGSMMRTGGLDFFADGKRAAVCTWNGDVWIVSGLGKPELGKVTWKRFAAGLFETLGLAIVDDVIYVNGRDQITRLHDLDGDGEADFYECFNNDVLTTRNFHEFAFDLQTDKEGNFYFSKAAPVRGGGRGFEKIVPHHGTVLRVSKDGTKLEVYASGLRAPNGIGVGPDGQVTSGDNEGTWVPHCKIHWMQPGSFQGVVDVAHRPDRPTTYNPPLCWLPMEVDNSGGGQVWITSERFGPFQGDLLHLSYGQSAILKVLHEEVEGQVQGGVFKLPVRLASGVMRGRFNPADGQLYVCGLKGWQTNAARLGCLQRVRYTGRKVALPDELHVTEKGLRLSFTCALDRELAEDPESYAIEQWNYVWGPMYGSPEISANDPDETVVAEALKSEQHGYRKHDKLEVASATLLPDGKSVFLEVPGIQPVMQMQIRCDLESAEGEELVFEISNTIHKLAKDPAR